MKIKSEKGKKTLVLSASEWMSVGKLAGWIKKADTVVAPDALSLYRRLSTIGHTLDDIAEKNSLEMLDQAAAEAKMLLSELRWFTPPGRNKVIFDRTWARLNSLASSREPTDVRSRAMDMAELCLILASLVKND